MPRFRNALVLAICVAFLLPALSISEEEREHEPKPINEKFRYPSPEEWDKAENKLEFLEHVSKLEPSNFENKYRLRDDEAHCMGIVAYRMLRMGRPVDQTMTTAELARWWVEKPRDPVWPSRIVTALPREDKALPSTDERAVLQLIKTIQNTDPTSTFVDAWAKTKGLPVDNAWGKHIIDSKEKLLKFVKSHERKGSGIPLFTSAESRRAGHAIQVFDLGDKIKVVDPNFPGQVLDGEFIEDDGKTYFSYPGFVDGKKTGRIKWRYVYPPAHLWD